MAQSSPNNLVVGFEFDTRKLRAQKEVLLQEIKNLTRQINEAGKAGDKTAVQALAADLGKLKTELAAVNQQIRVHTTVTRESTAAHHAEARSVRETAAEYLHLAREVGINIDGIKALKASIGAFSFVAVIKQVTDAVNKINELTQASRHIGVSTNTLQTWEKAVVTAGGSSDDAKAAISGLAEAFDNVNRKAAAAGRNVDDVVQTIHGANSAASDLGSGPLANILRGGQPPQKADFADPLGNLLGINTNQLKPGIENFDQNMLVVIRRILELHDTISKFKADQATKTLFGGRAFAELEQPFRQAAAAGNLQSLGQRLGVHFLTDEEKKAAAEAKRLFDDIKDSWEALVRSFSASTLPNIAPLFKDATKALDEFLTHMKEATAPGKTRWDEFLAIDDFTKTIAALERDYKAFIDFCAGVDKWFADAHKRLWEGIRASGPAAGRLGGGKPTLLPPSVSPEGNAAGGYIRGPGSGTSDSIPAWLSNGEYVVNAASTRRLGTGFLNALNGFAAGGLVGAPALRFAAGGLASATAGGGTPVHLHLGGRVFATTASSSVASALVSEAHRQAITSAGNKPSWYA